MVSKTVRPYLLMRPKHPDLIKAWEEFWVRYILKMAEEENLSLVSVQELRRREPLSQMNEASFQAAIEVLIERGLAKWWDRKRGLLRIYWCGPDYWIKKLIESLRARPTGIVNGVDGALELVPEMATLPREEVEELLELMVKRKLARWVDKKRRVLRILLT